MTRKGKGKTHIGRKAHGNAAKHGALVVIEGQPLDEQPAGVPAAARPQANRDSSGQFVSGPGTAQQAREAALAKAEAAKFRRLLGLWEAPEGHFYADYLRLAREHRDEHAAVLAAEVGGGRLSPGVSGILSSASLAMVASLYLYDLGAQTGDPKLFGHAGQLADKSRIALLTARELAAKDAEARPQPKHSAIVEAIINGPAKDGAE